MKKIFLLALTLFLTMTYALGQKTYSGSIDSRNAAIQLTNEAISEIKNKNYDSALNKLLASIKTDSTIRETYLRLYQVAIADHEHNAIIIEALNKGKRIFQEDDVLNFYCGEVYRLNANYEKAIIEYTNAMKYAKVYGEDFYLVPYYYLNRGNIYLKTGKLESALDDYNYLLKLDSTSTSGLTNRGITMYKLGYKDEACHDWEKAVKNGFTVANKYYQKYCNKN